VQIRSRLSALLALAIAVVACPAAAQEPKPGEVVVRIETALGNIEIAVDTKRAPITTGNFLKYVDGGFYDGGRFHRATRPDNYTPTPPHKPAMEIIQAGINPEKRRDAFPPIPLERTSVTGLKHVVGTVSMARTPDADSARSDFFICLDDQPSLDFGGKRFDDGQGGGAFGRVVKGMDVVRKIQQQPVEKQGTGPAETLTQRLSPPVTITRMSRVQ
jgi:peptidyl-prolyl cis-trans isomerase A (cyclophilin A)